MFLRFTTTVIDKSSKKREGVFVAAYRLLDSGDLDADEWKHLRELLDWFNEHLSHPPKSFTAGRAIFWFKSSATDCVGRVWELVYILQLHGWNVVVQKCSRLGNICYQDQMQVVAYPSPLDGRVSEQ
jgi:hypothetical protein